MFISISCVVFRSGQSLNSALTQSETLVLSLLLPLLLIVIIHDIEYI